MNKRQGFKFLLICILSSIIGNNVFSQALNYTLNRDYLWGFDNYYNSKEQNLQTFVKPYRYTDIKLISDTTAECPRLLDKKNKSPDPAKKSALEISPIISAVAGYQATSPSRFVNDLAIGGNLSMNLGEQFALNLKAFTGRAAFTTYTDSVIKETHVIPGIGYAYKSNNDSINTQYAYEYYSGYLSYSPNKIFNVQVGQDKHFWGDGYRSLFLSDVAAPYPFLKITTNVWHLTYVNLYTIMKDVTNPSGLKKDWLNKYATFHYLGWNATKRINIGLFESIVWQGSDSSRYRGYDVNYLNPIMFFRPTEYSLGSSDNAFLGFSFKIKMFRKQQLYGQLLLDEFLLKELKAQKGWWGNKQAFQAGFKSFDLFKIRKLNFQTEFNYVRPYTYAHGSVQQNYGHYNQPLAHPLGANFVESATFLNYRYKRVFLEAKCIYAVYGADSATTDYGKNIFISYSNRPHEYGNYLTQGFQKHLITTSLRVAYIVDARANLKIELGAAYRIEQNNYETKNTPFVFIGIRTDLYNLYDDY
ncbi:MAG: hypothetical protein A3F72_12560 [Bacteroidetes bacterium RIFCSPLOWO2_12_FULL_35_15]|nr:MAG: hypothetical protein A3F72_12560 [Bacteroidetes bacterium RIFCSPLOWO2_12_FULL_35_15]